MINSAIDVKKVLLINLPDEGSTVDSFTPDYAIGSFSVYPPLGLLYVATAIKAFYPVEVMDVVTMNWTLKQIVENIIKKAPTVLGISCQTLRLYPMLEIIRGVKAKLPETIVVIGGPHTAIYPAETVNLPGVDFVIIGDGEGPFKDLIDALSKGNMDSLKKRVGVAFKDEDGKLILNPPNYQNIEDIKIPDRTLLNYDYYYTAADGKEPVVSMISSRGCPFKCVFCDVQEKKYRARSAQSVVDEMEYIANLFDDPIIHVFDDNFNLLRKRVFEICEEIEKRNIKVKWTTRARVHPLDEEMLIAMKKAGLKRIHLGVESGSEISLVKMKKGIKKEQIVKTFELCRKLDIDTLAYFIIGYEWETKKDINATLKFIHQIFPTFIMVNTLYPVPKTEVYEELLKTGKIDKDYWHEFVSNPTKDYSLPQYKSKKMQRYLKRKLDEIYLTFYLSPRFILNNLRSKKSGENQKSSIPQLFFKIKLAFLIMKSYITSLILEKVQIGGGENEIN